MNVMETYNIGKTALDELKMVSDTTSSLVGFRKLISASDRALNAKKARIASTTKELLETYTKQAAAPQIQDMQISYDKDVKVIKEKLHTKLDGIIQAKQNVLSDFITASPSREQLNLLQTLQMRDLKNVGETEWGIIVHKLSTNHQTAQILAEMAKKAGKTFIAPFNPEDELETIEQFRNRANQAIENVGDLENSTMTREWVFDYNDSWIAETAKELDENVYTTVPDPDTSLINRLKSARYNCMHTGNWDLYNQIHAFIIDNSAAFETEKEREKNLREQAEYLIQLGMEAKEKRPTPYEQHRDAVIKDLEQAVEGKND